MKSLVDMAISKALKVWMQSQLDTYLAMESVSLDTKAASCTVSFIPHGEQELVELTIAPYTLVKGEEGYLVKAEGVQCSRLWLERLAGNYLLGKEYPVPAFVAKLI